MADSSASSCDQIPNSRQETTATGLLLQPPPQDQEENKKTSSALELDILGGDEDAKKRERGEGDGSSIHSSASEIYDYRMRPTSKSKVGSHKSLFFMLGMQFASSLAYYGIATNLVVYLVDKLHISNASAASDVNNWSGTIYCCSLIGAALGDACWGRYLTSVIFLFIYVIGMILCTISVSLPSLRPPDCVNGSVTCEKASPKQVGFFFLSLYTQALGSGAFQPCNTAFGADQYDENDPTERLQKSRYFSWIYLSSSFGGLFANSIIVYLEVHKSYKLGYSISSATLALALLLYMGGAPLHRYKKLQESPFTRVFQVPIAAIHKFHVQIPMDASYYTMGNRLKALCYLTPNNSGLRVSSSASIAQVTTNFLITRLAMENPNSSETYIAACGIALRMTSALGWFLDKAATITGFEENNPWRLCSVTQVEEVKCLLRLVPMWGTGIFFATIYSQITTTFIEQGSAMDTRLGRFTIPASSLNTIETLSVCVCGLAYETLLVPAMRKISGNPRGLTMLQRMGVGFVLSILAVVIAAVVEIKRLAMIKHLGIANASTATVPMSIFWLTPSFFLIGASEIFTLTGQYEFFYSQVPNALRAIGSGLQLSCFAMGSFLSSGLVSAVTTITKRGGRPGWISDNLNSGHLDYFYWLLVVLGTLNFGIYLISARWYKYIEVSEKAAK